MQFCKYFMHDPGCHNAFISNEALPVAKQTTGSNPYLITFGLDLLRCEQRGKYPPVIFYSTPSFFSSATQSFAPCSYRYRQS